MPALTGNIYEMANNSKGLDIRNALNPGRQYQDHKAQKEEYTSTRAKQLGVEMPQEAAPQEKAASPFASRIQSALDTVRLWRGSDYVFTAAESRTLEALLSGSENPDDVLSRFVASTSLAGLSDYDVKTVYDNLDQIAQYYTGKDYMPNDSSLYEKVKASFDTIEAQRIMAKYKDAYIAGDYEKAREYESQAQAILDQIGDVLAGVPQNMLDSIATTLLEQTGYIYDVMQSGGLWSMATTAALTGLVAISHLNPISAGIAYAAIPAFSTAAAKIGSFYETTSLAEAQSFWDLMHDEEAPVNPSAANVLSLLNGLFVGATETFLDGITSRGVNRIGGKKLSELGISMLVDSFATRGSNRFAYSLLDWVTGGVDEALLNEFPQQVWDYMTGVAYRHMSGVPTGFDFGEMMSESFKAAADGLLVGLAYGGMGIPLAMRDYNSLSLELRRQANATLSREDYFDKTDGLKPESMSTAAYHEAQSRIWEASVVQREEYMAKNYAGSVMESLEIAQGELYTATDKDGNQIIPDGSVARTAQGRLYTEEIATPAETTVVFGNQDQGRAWGSVSFTERADTVRINSVRVGMGYEALRAEMLAQVFADYGFGKTIEWNPTTKGLQAVKQSLIDNNPDKTGLNYKSYATKASTQALADQIQKKMSLTRPEALVSAQLYLMADRGALSANNNGQIFGNAQADGIELNGRRGATNIAKSLIYAGENADVSTFTHELFHAAAAVRPTEKRELTEAVRNTVSAEKSRAELEAFIKDHQQIWGDKFDIESVMKSFENITSIWTREQEENLARLYEAYRSSTQSQRRSLPEKIKAALLRLADYINRIYNALRDTVPLNENIAKAFDKLTGIEKPASSSSTSGISDGIRYQDASEGEYGRSENQLRSVTSNFDEQGRHLAPNGEPSNLPYRQWVMVRTPSFKRWFGDWEGAANLEWLMNSEPIAILSGEEFRENVIDNAADLYKTYGNRVYREGLGYVTLTRHDIQSSVSHGLGRKKAAAFAAVPDVIRNGREFNRTENYKDRGYDSVVVAAPVSIAGEDYVCEVVLNKRENSNNFYLHEVEVRNKLQFSNQVRNYMDENHPNRNTETGAPRLIISRLFAEGKFNASKVIDENGEPLSVYHGTYEDFSVFDRTKARANMDIQGNFFSPWPEDAAGHGPNVRAFFLNLKNPADHRTAYAAFEKFKGQDNAGVKAREHLESQGFDGVNFDGEEYIAFEPAQIKSIDNNGSFDSENPDVYFQEAVNQIDEGIHQSALNADENKEQAVSDYLKENGLDIPSEDVIVLSDNAVIIKDDTGYDYDKDKLEQLKASVYEQLSLFNLGGSDNEPRNTGTAKRRKNPSQRRNRSDSSTPLFPELRGTYPETFTPGSGWSGRERNPQTVEGKWNSFGYVRFIGAQINSPSDIAKLYSIYRNPQLEYFHIVLLKEGKIVRQIGMSSGLPSITLAVPYGVNSREELARYFDNEDFDQLYLIHNHPSGNPSPSGEDLSVTAAYIKAYAGKDVKHVILDHSTFSLLEAPDKTNIAATSNALPDGIHKIEMRATLSETLSSPLDIVSAARRLSDTGTHVFYLSSQHKVFAFDSFDVSDFDKSVSNLLQEMRDKSYATGAIVTDSDSDFSAIKEAVRNRRLPVLDIIWIGDKRYISLLETGELETYRWDRTAIASMDRSAAMKWDSINNPDVLFQDDFDRSRYSGLFRRAGDPVPETTFDPSTPQQAADAVDYLSPPEYPDFYDVPDDGEYIDDLLDPAKWDSLVKPEDVGVRQDADYTRLPIGLQMGYTYEEAVEATLPDARYVGTDSAKDAQFIEAMDDSDTFYRYMYLLGESLNLNRNGKNGYRPTSSARITIDPYTDQNHREQIQAMVNARVSDVDVREVAKAWNMGQDVDSARAEVARKQIKKNARIWRDFFADLTGNRDMKPKTLIEGRLDVQTEAQGSYRSIDELAKIAREAGFADVETKLKSGNLKMVDIDNDALKRIKDQVKALRRQYDSTTKTNEKLNTAIKDLKATIAESEKEKAENDKKINGIIKLLDRNVSYEDRLAIDKEYVELSEELHYLEHGYDEIWNMFYKPTDGRTARGHKKMTMLEGMADSDWRKGARERYGLDNLNEIKARIKELQARLKEIRLTYAVRVARSIQSRTDRLNSKLDRAKETIEGYKTSSAATKAQMDEMNHYITSLQERLAREEYLADKIRNSENVELSRLRNEVANLRQNEATFADKMEQAVGRLEANYEAMLRHAQNQRDQIIEKQKQQKALEEIRAEKASLARMIMEPVNLATTDWETGGQAIMAIQSMIDPQFRRDWIYALDVNLRGEAKKGTMTIPEAQNYFIHLDDEGRQAVIDALSPQVIARLTGQRKPLNDWTVDELREMANEVYMLRKLGRETLRAKNAFLQEQAKYIVKSMLDTLRPMAGGNLRNLPGSQESIQHAKNPKTRISQLIYSSRRPQELVQLIDGGYGNQGPAYNLLIDEKRYHQNRALERMDERFSVIDPLITRETAEKLAKTHRIDFGDGYQQTFTLDDLAYIWLSQYEAQNRAAVAFGTLITQEEKGTGIPRGLDENGRPYREYLTSSVIADDEVLERIGWDRYRIALGEAHLALGEEGLMDFVSAIEKDLNSQGERLQKMMVTTFNQPIHLVEHYLPIRRKDLTGENMDLSADAILNYGNSTVMHNPEKGFTIQRVNVPPRQQTPVNTSLLSVWRNAVRQQEWLIESAAYIKKLHRIFNNKEFQNALQGAYSPDLYREITDYIDLIANPYKQARKSNAEKTFRALRGNLAAAYLGWKASGIITQAITSPMPFLSDISPVRLIKAYMDIAQDYSVLAEIDEKSTMMKHRSMSFVVEELAQRVLDAGNNKAIESWYKFTQTGMKGLEWIDRVAVAGGWLAKYQQELQTGLDKGLDTETAETAAVKAADDLVLKVQPTGDKTELASMFRTESEFAKAILQFTTSLNVIWNNITADLQGYLRNKEYGKVTGTLAGYALAGLLLGAALTGFDDDDDAADKARKVGYFTLTQFMDSVPWIGSMVNEALQHAITGERDFYGSSSLFPAANELLQTFDAFSSGDVVKGLEKLGRGIGLVTGLPTSMLGQVKDAIMDADPWKLIGR